MSEDVRDILDVARLLQKRDGDDVPCLDIQLCECRLISDVENVKCIFECVVVLCFVAIHGDDVWWSFVTQAIVLIDNRDTGIE